MRIALNGKPVDAEEGISLRALLEGEGYNLDAIAILVNGEIISKERDGDRPLAEGDSVEVVSFMSGG